MQVLRPAQTWRGTADNNIFLTLWQLGLLAALKAGEGASLKLAGLQSLTYHTHYI